MGLSWSRAFIVRPPRRSSASARSRSLSGAGRARMPTAVENITRKQLNPYEEARAVKAMLDRGLTDQGAADVLGWSINRVAARVKLLALPERAQQMVGAGEIPLSAVDQLVSIGAAAPALLEA